MTNLEHFIQTHRNSNLLIDTNILILLLVGGAGENLIEKLKPTRAYNKDDYHLVISLTKHFRIVTTPHILAEASNLCEKIEKFYQRQVMHSFTEAMFNILEFQVSSQIATSTPVFLKMGLTGSVIHYLGKQGLIVLTDDFDLFSYLFNTGVQTVNINHLRSDYILPKR